MVEQNDPNNMEAVFFSAFGKAMFPMTDDDYYKRLQKFNVLIRSISVINNFFEVTNEDKPMVLNKIAKAITKMYNVTYVYDITAGSDVGGNTWMKKLLNQVKNGYAKELNQILSVHNEPYIQEILNKVNALQTANGCYVATAVYGSYDCPEVWTLRRFRDNTLAGTWYGRAFIRTYYAISPTLVKWFGHTGWFKNLWRKKLDRMVANLQTKGFESTPYEDKNW